MEFRSNISFNSTSWQCPRWCPSKIGLVLAGSPPEPTSWQILRHVEEFATMWQLSHDKNKIGDMSPTCRRHVLAETGMSWLCLEVGVCGFAVSADPGTPRFTPDRHRTLLGHAFCRGLITWIGHSPWRRLGIPAPQRGQKHHGVHNAEWLPKWLGFQGCCRDLLPLNRQRIIQS